ncbi:S8 family serine peptidase [Ferrimonas pelagia]|uniref:S8 family serine peptidase n=2 Tax=Ferrimonas pelagia TaxID=1177826 RepID=A0ABP9ED24_9GAMM
MGAQANSSSASATVHEGHRTFRAITLTPPTIESAPNSLYNNDNKRNLHVAPADPTEIFAPEQDLYGEHDYIVILEDHSVVVQQALTQTASATTSSANLQAVRTQALQQQSTWISQVQAKGIALNVKRQYALGINGLVAHMDQNAAMALAQQSGIRKIYRARTLELLSDNGPSFVGADQIWQGTAGGMAYQGDGVVVGIIDTGINTQHASFSANGIDNPLGDGVFLGDCVEDASLCNNKLIGVYSFDEITEAYADPVFQPEVPVWQTPDPLRPANGEDYNGHGSHVASTVAGNMLTDVPYQIPANEVTSNGTSTDLDIPQISGMAPNANVISYQVCYPGGAGDPFSGCPETALLAAIEQAIMDQVDVINFSIGGGESFPWEDAVELAFLSAREAGINVAAAAGNSGPYFFSTDHTSPWLTSVAATTHERVFSVPEKTVGSFSGGTTLPSSDEYSGNSISGAITAPVVYAGDYDNPNSDLAPELCAAPFPADTFSADKDGNPLSDAPIVLCYRGEVARLEKAVNVQAGGAGGLIHANMDWSGDSATLVDDPFVIPGIHISRRDGDQIKTWLADGSDHRASITAASPERLVDPANADFIADFSSRGPSWTNANYLVPNIAAPGVSVYAAWTNDQPFSTVPMTADYTAISGTSMASPHVAGGMALLAGLRPDWSPAEIQSAIMLTANQGVKRKIYENILDLDAPYYVGSGRMDVAAAANAGLVMDIPVDEYLAANPNNGGYVNRLNTPNMVEMECRKQCSWLRTVKATTSGSWTSEAAAWEGYEGATFTVSPAQFSLQAGESQVLEITATINEDIYSKSWEGESADNEYVHYFGTIALIADNGAIPVSTMQAIAGYNRGDAPVELNMTVGRDEGYSAINGIQLPAFNDFTAQFLGPVAPSIEQFHVAADTYWLNPFDDITDGAAYTSITIEEGTERFVAEVLKAEAYDYENLYIRQPTLIVGRSADGSGIPPVGIDAARPEILCISQHATEGNYCAFNTPAPGTYWIVVHNINDSWQHEGQIEIDLATAVITSDSQGMLSLTGPASHDGVSPLSLDFGWNWPDSQPGDVLYGAVNMGPSASAPAGFGFSGLRLERDVNDIHISQSQSTANAGDIIDFALDIRQNLEATDRELNINVTLPEGLTLIPDSVQYDDQLGALLNQEDGRFIISGVQPSSAEVERKYNVSTNFDNPQCMTPDLVEDWHGGYIDLHSMFGLQPWEEWMQGDANSVFNVPIDYLFYKPADIMLYGRPSTGTVQMTAAGLFNLADGEYYSWHYGMAIGMFQSAFAPLFNDAFETTYKRHWEDPQGLTIISLWEEDNPDLGDVAILEFDNLVDTSTGGQIDVQAILRSGLDFRPNHPELTFAYNNITGDMARGIIGTIGYAGAWDLWGEGGGSEGTFYDIFGLDNLDEVLQDDLVVCYDYDGPERTAMQLKFKVRVHEDASSTEQTVSLTHQFGSSSAVTESHSVAVSGNLQLATIADQTTDENMALAGIEVFYTDGNTYPNTIEVSGEHVTATVHGHESGATFDLMPDPDFHGQTEITVIVRDSVHSSDMASTSFMLTVNSDGVEPTPEPEPEPEPDSNSSSSGSFGGFALLLLAGFGLRRRTR